MKEICEKALCCGCASCEQSCPKHCIKMIANKEGFWYPEIDQNECIDCGKCVRSCPVNGDAVKENRNRLKAYAAYCKDERVRLQSSSGGIFTIIAERILKQGGAVFGAAYTQNFTVAHECVECEKDLVKLRGAKYAQSDLGRCFGDIRSRLQAGQLVLFSGTPCQVAGLKSFLQKPYANLFTIDFACHGVPSPLAWEKYVQYRAQQDNSGILPETINLRSKSTGWSRYQYSNVYMYPDGTKYSASSGEDLFMRLFVGDYINRKSCSKCHFKGYQRCSDLTLGDFWGIWDIAPEMDDNKGTSMVLVQSESGKEMLQQIADDIVLKAVTLEQTSVWNSQILISLIAKAEREIIIQKCLAGEFEEVQSYLNERTAKQQKKTRLCSVARRILQKFKRIM